MDEGLGKPVLCLTGDAILAMDIKEAVEAEGLPVVTAPEPRATYRAIIVDADIHSRTWAAIVRPHCAAQVPIVALADTDELAEQVGGPGALRFSKPVSTDDLAARIAALLRRAGPRAE